MRPPPALCRGVDHYVRSPDRVPGQPRDFDGVSHGRQALTGGGGDRPMPFRRRTIRVCATRAWLSEWLGGDETGQSTAFCCAGSASARRPSQRVATERLEQECAVGNEQRTDADDLNLGLPVQKSIAWRGPEALGGSGIMRCITRRSLRAHKLARCRPETGRTGRDMPVGRVARGRSRRRAVGTIGRNRTRRSRLTVAAKSTRTGMNGTASDRIRTACSVRAGADAVGHQHAERKKGHNDSAHVGSINQLVGEVFGIVGRPIHKSLGDSMSTWIRVAKTSPSTNRDRACGNVRKCATKSAAFAPRRAFW